MQDFEKLGAFYLGQTYDLATKTASDVVMYDSRDLTTHAVCVGMTGSGKTGLCLALIEEALIDGVPVIAIDPKGDLGNLALTFPSLAPSDFKPWIDPAAAERDGLTLDQEAEKAATRWRDGLAATGQSGERIAKLRAAGEVAIYTPGSEAGIPLSLLRSFRAPPKTLADDAEAWRDRVEAAVSGLLALVGIAADPLKSREHVLLSQIVDAAWRAGEDLGLAALIQRVTKPPFTQVGAFDIETFYPAKERTELALVLNSLLASPSFQPWTKGEPLDVAQLLYTPQGKPRIAVMSIAHLSDAERMFFVTLLLQEVIAWMRSQPGTSSLRAVVFMDEVAGYLPPVAAPPSKKPMLTLLKQARAFGVGMVLASQNPVDVDYKALANAGTWFLGRLQTERDKARVIEGLEGASAAAGKTFDKAAMEATLAGLTNRVFVLQNAHDDHPIVFQSRFALSYLAGPLTRAQIQRLSKDDKDGKALASTPSPAAVAPTTSTARPVVPAELHEEFSAGTHLAPALLGVAKAHYVQAKNDIDVWAEVVAIAPLAEDTAGDFWEHAELGDMPSTTSEPAPNATFAALPRALTAKVAGKLSDQFEAWVYRTGGLTLWSAPDVGLVSRPGERQTDFRARVALAQRERRDAAVDKLKAKYKPKLDALAAKVAAAEQRRAREQAQATRATTDSAIAIGAGVLGALFGGRRATATRVASAARSVSRTVEQRGDVGRAAQSIETLQAQHDDLEAQLAADVAAVQSDTPATIEPLEIKPRKADTSVTKVALLWSPCAMPDGG